MSCSSPYASAQLLGFHICLVLNFGLTLCLVVYQQWTAAWSVIRATFRLLFFASLFHAPQRLAWGAQPRPLRLIRTHLSCQGGKSQTIPKSHRFA